MGNQAINITPILQAVIGLLCALITYRLIPWIKARTTNEQQIYIQAAIRVAVYAMEQIYGAGHGEEKLAGAIKWLAERGIVVERNEVEAVVYSELNSMRNLIIPTDKPPESIE